MSVEIIPVAPPAVAGIWPIVEPLLVKSIELSQGCYLPEDVREACQLGIWQQGGMQLLVAAEEEEVVAAYCMEVFHTPRKRVLNARFAGGLPHSMDKWLEPMLAEIESMRKQLECAATMAVGRKGWAKVVEGREVGIVLWRESAGLELH